MTNPIYEPREDSFLLKRNIKKYAEHAYSCLDIGTGSGILALEASKYCQKTQGIDINPIAIKHCKKKYNKIPIKFKQSNFFSNIKSKFNLIICNPPYLPNDPRIKDIALDGGPQGFEFIEKLFTKLNSHLTENGTLLLLFSNLTKKNIIDNIITSNLYTIKQIDQQDLFHEKLYVYEIKKSDILKILNKKNIKNLEKLTQGKRGSILTGTKNNKKVTIKVQRLDKYSQNTINFEINNLKLLNNHNIGPILLDHGNNFFIYKYIEGIFIEEYIEIHNKEQIKKILINLAHQMYTLDQLKLNKEEMHHPYKHILITKEDIPVLIDFERCKINLRPKNITQFIQFITSTNMINRLKTKNFNLNKEMLKNEAKEYKNLQNKENFNKIITLIK